MEDLRKSYTKTIERYTAMIEEFSKQLDFICQKQFSDLDLPLMRLQLMLRNWEKNENDAMLKQEFENIDENIISFRQEALSKSQLIMNLMHFQNQTLFEKRLECDQLKRVLQLRELLETMQINEDPWPTVINTDQVSQFIENCAGSQLIDDCAE